MTRSLFISAALVSVAITAGCGTRPTSNPSQPGTPPTTAPAAVVVIFRAEPDVLSIRPGDKAQVKLLSVPKDVDLMVSIDPPDSRVTAVVDRDTLTVQAGDGATGQSKITVQAGKESARVTVNVEPGKE